MKTIQITPTYPPAFSGVGDYAALLEQRLNECGVPIQTLVATQLGIPKAQANGPNVLELASATKLVERLSGCDKILLHFSGYSYASRGLCHWLVDGLKNWKKEDPSRRLVIIFHEVYATGPIWRMSFWTAGSQRRIARDLAKLSDVYFVTSLDGANRLTPLCPRLKPEVLPVFSTIGEPKTMLPLKERPPLAVIFGGASRRARVYQSIAKHETLVANILSHLEIEKILDIGPSIPCPARIGSCRVETLGAISANAASEKLSTARLGFFDYPSRVFTKSSIAAAYFAHGLLVLNSDSSGGLPPDILDMQLFSSIDRLEIGQIEASHIAAAGHAWYQEHNIKIVARHILKALTDSNFSGNAHT